ncbi:hypothetical protein KJZ67_04410 [Patescibacteria group bacterium]|nr:hypothetical protein [Patescibacteria group bacterium]
MPHSVEKPLYLSGLFIHGAQKYPVRIEVTRTRAGWQAMCTSEAPRRTVIPPYTGSFGPHKDYDELLTALRTRLSNVREVIEL